MGWVYTGTSYRRRPTRTVRVGDVEVGGDHPIRVQSMTTPATTDTAATVAQIERLVEAGCEIVRLTVPTSNDADNLPAIRAALARRAIRVPLVADIHFTPAAAMKAVEHVDKIRINPGNYADKKKFAVREYSDAQYAAELERIATVFSPLVLRARELGVSMRIGTNHGSLSDRIMNRYGDTPRGMVESALEFVRICEAHGYRELILSMKASNPLVVQHAYRLLVERMAAEDMHYPLHLGVTEAGDGEDGRVKSAMGIGTLLEEGIGDTVRVSLTEDPVAEIPVCRRLVERFNRMSADQAARPSSAGPAIVESRDPHSYTRRVADPLNVGPLALGGERTVAVEVPLRSSLDDEAALRAEIDAQTGVRVAEEMRADLISVGLRRAEQIVALERLRGSIRLVAPRLALSARVELAWLGETDRDGLSRWVEAADRLHVKLRGDLETRDRRVVDALAEVARAAGRTVLLECGSEGDDGEAALATAVALAASSSREPRTLLLALDPTTFESPLYGYRRLVARLDREGLRTPLVLLDDAPARGADPLLGPSTALGGLLSDGTGDAIHLIDEEATASRRLAFGILQAARVRITRTEFISCPSCGRTLFDLEETTARIKARTAHLKGVKIAIMGCVVNGPGEMADADFGYVGWGDNKIALFVGKDMVARDVPTDRADERLVELIKQHGRWVDPPVHA